VYEKPAQAFSVVVQLGGAKSIRNDERKSGDAEAAIRKHHHLTRNINAASETLHAKIQWMKYLAPGFRNKQNFINAIHFHFGGLDLDPSPTK
jgi:hypothetical protein